MALANRRKILATGRHLVGDTSKTIIASPGAGFRIRIYKIIAFCAVSAAQAIHVGESIAEAVMSIPASATGTVSFDSEEGFAMDPNVACGSLVAVAGPAWIFHVEYLIEQISPS